MKKVPKVVYDTPALLAERIRRREADAAELPPGIARRSVLVEIAQLRVYADMKRWIEAPEAASTTPKKIQRGI
jgi:hypothetical protein